MNTTTPTPPTRPSRTAMIAVALGVIVAGIAIAVVATRGNDSSENTVSQEPDETTTTEATSEPTTDETAGPEETTTSSTSEPTSTSITSVDVERFEYPNIGNVAFYDGLALGWWDGAAWVAMPDGVDGPITDPPVFPAQPVRYLDDTGQTVTREVSALDEQCIEFGNMWSVGDDPSTGERIGTSGDWELRPRPVEEIAIDEAHRQAVRDVLAAQDVSEAEIVIQQVVRLDVDGDGTDEVLIAAENIDSSGALFDQTEGSYSMVLLRRVTPTGVETIDLSSDVVTAAEMPDQDEFGGFIAYSELVDVADLNGDGVFEAVIATGYYEGGSILIFSLGTTPAMAAGAGCGV